VTPRSRTDIYEDFEVELNAVQVELLGTFPRLVMRARTSGEFMIFTVSRPSHSTMALEVLAGTNRPNHTVISNSLIRHVGAVT
jgi:hypothetical protein